MLAPPIVWPNDICVHAAFLAYILKISRTCVLFTEINWPETKIFVFITSHMSVSESNVRQHFSCVVLGFKLIVWIMKRFFPFTIPSNLNNRHWKINLNYNFGRLFSFEIISIAAIRIFRPFAFRNGYLSAGAASVEGNTPFDCFLMPSNHWL